MNRRPTWQVIDGGLCASGAGSLDPPSLGALREVRRRIGAAFGDELRHPLRETERRIALLLEGGHGPLGGAQREELRAAGEAAEFVSSLLSLLGMVMDDEDTPPEAEVIDVRFPLWDVVDEHAAVAKARRIRLELRLPETPIPVRAGREWSRTILRFVLREHLCGVGPGGRVTVAGEPSGDMCHVRFERAGGSPKRSYAPHRTGCALTRTFLEKHDGRLAVRSGGALWLLELPLATPVPV